jgi:hypothetical protein
VRGYQESVRWLQDPENRDAAIENIMAEQEIDEDMAAEAYDFFVTELPAEDPTGEIKPENLQKTIENAQAAGVESVQNVDTDDLEQFYTNDLVEAASALEP